MSCCFRNVTGGASGIAWKRCCEFAVSCMGGRLRVYVLGGICGATGLLCVTRRMPGEERIGCIKVERKEVPLALPWCFLISL